MRHLVHGTTQQNVYEGRHSIVNVQMTSASLMTCGSLFIIFFLFLHECTPRRGQRIKASWHTNVSSNRNIVPPSARMSRPRRNTSQQDPLNRTKLTHAQVHYNNNVSKKSMLKKGFLTSCITHSRSLSHITMHETERRMEGSRNKNALRTGNKTLHSRHNGTI